MAYRRPKGCVQRPSDVVLSRRLAGIGFGLATRADRTADLEVTLVHASELGMDAGDLRVLSLLTTWLGTHSRAICVDRLRRLLLEHPSTRVRTYWAAIADSESSKGRLEPLANLNEGQAQDLLESGAAFLLRRHGQDPRFNSAVLRVPKGTLRERASDVATPEELAPRHRGYALRIMLGPGYRAVLWEHLEREPELSPSEAGRRARSSFSTAWEAVRDFRLIRGSKPAAVGTA